jgi:hypothetical protein
VAVSQLEPRYLRSLAAENYKLWSMTALNHDDDNQIPLFMQDAAGENLAP